MATFSRGSLERIHPRRLAALACGLAVFAAYLVSLSPSLAGGDSGELIAVAHDLGVAHPPGYPLYTILGKLFTLIPLGTTAWRVNLLSAVADASAAGLLCYAIATLTGQVWGGLLAGGLFGFSPIVWPYAVTAEVFALNNLFVAGLFFLSVKSFQERTRRSRPSGTLLFTAFWVALGLTNHHTFAFFGLPMLAFMAFREKEVLGSARNLSLMGGLFLLGLLPYLYLPVASARVPEMAWGDQTSVGGLLEHLLRQEYGTLQLATEDVGGGGGDFLERFTIFWRRLAGGSFLLELLLFPAAGLALRRGSRLRLPVGIWGGLLLIYVVVFASLANVRLDDPLHVTVQDRFWQQSLVVATGLIGIGFSEIARRIPASSVRFTAPVFALAVPLVLAVTQFGQIERGNHHLFRDYGRAVLAPLPQAAILLVSSDEAHGSVRYVQEVEGYRRDVRTIPAGHLTRVWFRRFAERRLPGVRIPDGAGGLESFTAREFLDANFPESPIFVLNRVPWLSTLEESYRLWPVGLVEEVMLKGQTPDLASWVTRTERGFASFDARRASRFPRGSWEWYLAGNYFKLYQRFSLLVPQAAVGHTGDQEALRIVIRALEGYVGADPSPDPTAFKNLGVAHQFLSRTDPSAVGPMVIYWRRYLKVGPSGDPDRAAIRTILEQSEQQAVPSDDKPPSRSRNGA